MRHMWLALILSLSATSALAGGVHGKSTSDMPGPEVDRSIKVTAGDLWFKPDDLSISPGETVRFVIENIGKVEHEFVIGGAEEQQAHREIMQGAASNGGGHHDMSADHHGTGNDAMPSVTIASGETKTLLWTATDKASNDLLYACNIPGHFEAGMHGEFDIKD